MLTSNKIGSLLKLVSLMAVVIVAGCATATSKPGMAEAPTPSEPPTEVVTKQVVLDASTLFAFDSADLTNDGMATLDGLIREAGGQDAGQVTVTGHTDRIGDAEYNMGLSERRANSVADYMVQRGVSSGRITTVARGESEPVVQCEEQPWNALVACLAPNRRVVVEYPVMVEEEVVRDD